MIPKKFNAVLIEKRKPKDLKKIEKIIDVEDRCISNHSVFPEEGDMYIFPAWLKHWVYPFKTDCTRISVSGNVIDKIGLDKLKKANGKE